MWWKFGRRGQGGRGVGLTKDRNDLVTPDVRPPNLTKWNSLTGQIEQTTIVRYNNNKRPLKAKISDLRGPTWTPPSSSGPAGWRRP